MKNVRQLELRMGMDHTEILALKEAQNRLQASFQGLGAAESSLQPSDH